MQAKALGTSPPREMWAKKNQFIVYLGFAALLVGLAALQNPLSKADFDTYFGGLSPVLVVAAAGMLGFGALAVLDRKVRFQIIGGRPTLRGITVSAGYATILGVAIVVADLMIRYPEDTNVPMPRALLFYPTVGFVAELVFHVLPFTLFLLALSPLRHRLGVSRMVWISIVVTAAAEPTFQVLFKGEPLRGASLYTWVHVFAIAFLQLQVFKRYDFASMYIFRLTYYAYWHIIWGMIRLEVMF